MISDSIVKRDYVISVLNRDVANIYNASLLVAQHNIYISGKDLTAKKGKKGSALGSRTGALLRSLESPDYTVSSSSDSFHVSANIVLHERFLDMRAHGNYKIYNRQVWGILYNNALPDIKYNVGKEITNAVGNALREAFRISNPPTS